MAAHAAQFTSMAATLVSIGTLVMAQGLLLDERRSGVLEWMLSKPLNRSAMLAATLLGHGIALVVVLVVVPWVGVGALLSLAEGAWWPLGRWLAAVTMVALLVFFYLAVVLALSALTWSRAVALALPLAGILGGDLLVSLLPDLANWLPTNLGRVAGPVLAGAPMASFGPLIATVGLTAVALVVASVAFHREEL